jgi:hypothetical protein
MKTKRKKKQIDAQEALARARSQMSLANYPAIYAGFEAKGIPEAEIKPRENVFTFHAWRALGRQVRKGEHGVKVLTVIPIGGKEETDPETGEKTITSVRTRGWSTTVFHLSQTDPLETFREPKPANPETTVPIPGTTPVIAKPSWRDRYRKVRPHDDLRSASPGDCGVYSGRSVLG